MNAQEYLEQFRGLEYLIKAKKETLENTAAFYGRLPITNPTITSQVASIQGDLEANIEKMVLSQKDLCRMIDVLPDKELKAVLTLRYVGMKTWEQVAKMMDVSVRWVYNLHERALKAFEVVLHLNPDNNLLVTNEGLNP